MTNKRDPEHIVSELLAGFSEPDIKKSKTGKNVVQSEAIKMPALDFDKFANGEDVAALCSLLLSLVASAAGSTVTGYAHNILTSMWPTIAKEMVGEHGITQEHVDLITTLLKSGLKPIARDDATRPVSEQKVPVLLEKQVQSLVQFGIAMHALGKLNGPIRFQAGFKTTVLKVVNEQLAAGGVAPEKGTLPERLIEIIDGIVDAEQKKYEGTNGE